MKIILKYLKPYWWLALAAPVLMLLEVLMDLQQPRLMSTIVDEGVLAGDMDVIWTTGRTMILMAFVGLIGGAGCSTTSSIASTSFAADLRKALFRKVNELSLAQGDIISTGSLITRLTNDVNTIAELVITFTRMLIRTPLLLFGGVVMVYMMNGSLTLPLLISAPILALVIVLHLRRGKPMFQTLQKRIDEQNAVLQENLTGMRVVKAFTLEGYERERFTTSNDNLMDAGLRIGKLMATMGPALTLVQNAVLIVMLYSAVRLASADLLHIGQVMAVVNYTTQILFALIMMSFILMGVSRAQVSLGRVKEILDMDTDIAGGAHDEPPANGDVVFENVTFRYPRAAGRPVLDSVSLEIKSGERVAFLGATGSGKTTLVNLINRMYDPFKGRVLVGGRDAKAYTLKALRTAVGVVPQETRLFTGTIMENLLWGDADATLEDVQAFAAIAQADEFIATFAEGYETEVLQGGMSLSGGQKQRMAIARALLRKPRILILDDATSAIDLRTESKLNAAMRDAMGDMTVITIAQRIASVMNADRIYVLEDGRVSACGTHLELLENSNLYRDIFMSQMGEGAVFDAG